MAQTAVRIILSFVISHHLKAETILTNYTLYSCSLNYDIYTNATSQRYNSVLNNTESSACVSIVNGVCDCKNTFFLNVLQGTYEDQNNSFALTSNSILDYQLSFNNDDVYHIDSFYQYWEHYGDRPTNESFVEFIASNGSSYNVSFAIDKSDDSDISEFGAYLSVEVDDIDDLYQYAMEGIHVHLEFSNETDIPEQSGGNDDRVFIGDIMLEVTATSSLTSSPTEDVSFTNSDDGAFTSTDWLLSSTTDIEYEVSTTESDEYDLTFEEKVGAVAVLGALMCFGGIAAFVLVCRKRASASIGKEKEIDDLLADQTTQQVQLSEIADKLGEKVRVPEEVHDEMMEEFEGSLSIGLET